MKSSLKPELPCNHPCSKHTENPRCGDHCFSSTRVETTCYQPHSINSIPRHPVPPPEVRYLDPSNPTIQSTKLTSARYLVGCLGNERSSAPESSNGKSSTTNHHPGGMPQQFAQDGLKRRLGPSHLGVFGSRRWKTNQ